MESRSEKLPNNPKYNVMWRSWMRGSRYSLPIRIKLSMPSCALPSARSHMPSLICIAPMVWVQLVRFKEVRAKVWKCYDNWLKGENACMYCTYVHTFVIHLSKEELSLMSTLTCFCRRKTSLIRKNLPLFNVIGKNELLYIVLIS